MAALVVTKVYYHTLVRVAMCTVLSSFLYHLVERGGENFPPHVIFVVTAIR